MNLYNHLLSKLGNHTHQYIPRIQFLSGIPFFASMQLNSHSLLCEMRCWDTSKYTRQLRTCEQVWKPQYHILIQFNVFNHVRLLFSNIVNLVHSLHTFPQGHNVPCLLQCLLIKFLNNKCDYSIPYYKESLRFCAVEMSCVSAYVCVRERVRETQDREWKYSVILQKENDQHFTRWEQSALYSHPLSSITTRHMKHGECGSS